MEFIIEDLNDEKLLRDGKACLDITSQILDNKKVKLHFEEEIEETFEQIFKRIYIEMFDEFEDDKEVEGARKLLNKFLELNKLN
ncbi:MAG: hypothetical protein ACRDD7_10450 [Peptostreptococcaceae bacterium]